LANVQIVNAHSVQEDTNNKLHTLDLIKLTVMGVAIYIGISVKVCCSYPSDCNRWPQPLKSAPFTL